MNSQFNTMLPKFTDLMSSKLFYEELVNSECLSMDDDYKDDDENFYDINEIEEVFSDHVLMGKRLQRSLYRGSIHDLDDDTDHPPIALTDLALKFFSKAVPNYGLDQLDMDYVSSVSESTRVSPCAMILALIYLERLQIKNTDYLDSVSPSGLFVVTMLVASKFLFENEDDIVTNQIWSETLNIDVKELNRLEQKFLAAIDWQLYVDSSEFFQYLAGIEKMIALKQSSERGWLSYSDICFILQDAVIRKSIVTCIERIIKVSVVSAVSYALTVLSIYTAGCAVHFKCNENQPLKETVQMKNNTQRFYPEITNVELQHDANLIAKPSAIESLFETLALKFEDTSYIQNNDFSHSFPSENIENLSNSMKKYSVITYISNTLSSLQVKSKYKSDNHNSLQNDILNYTIYKLMWRPSGFKNTCIPLSVK